MENTFKFNIGDTVSFERNQVIKSEGTVIVAVVDNQVPEEIKKRMSETVEEIPNSYIVENEHGWKPSTLRQLKFGLNPEKKYLFVSEEELELVN